MKNKFITAIAGNTEGIKLARAEAVATQAKLAQESLINDLAKNVNTLSAALTNTLDIGPDSSDSLRPVGPNFDAGAWVHDVQALKVDIKKAQERLDIAKETYAEWFSEQPAPAAR